MRIIFDIFTYSLNIQFNIFLQKYYKPTFKQHWILAPFGNLYHQSKTVEKKKTHHSKINKKQGKSQIITWSYLSFFYSLISSYFFLYQLLNDFQFSIFNTSIRGEHDSITACVIVHVIRTKNVFVNFILNEHAFVLWCSSFLFITLWKY